MDGVKRYLLLGVALGTLEATVLPPAWPLRLGLANAATLAAALSGLRPALAVAVGRSLLVAVATGTWLAPSGVFSLLGGVASALVMAAVVRAPVSLVLASACGGVASSLVQVGVFGFFAGVGGADVLALSPWFALWGALTGAFSGAALHALGAASAGEASAQRATPLTTPATSAICSGVSSG